MRESEQRTRDYRAHGPRGPVTWILVEGRDIPDRAIFTGEERGQHVYTCRAWHEVSPSVDAVCLRWAANSSGLVVREVSVGPARAD